MSKINLPNKRKEQYLSRRKFDDDGNIVEKQCSSCNEFISVENYYKSNKEFDGLYNYCKVCFKTMNKERYKLGKVKGKGNVDSDDLDTFFRNDLDSFSSGSLDNIIDDLSKNREDYD